MKLMLMARWKFKKLPKVLIMRTRIKRDSWQKKAIEKRLRQSQKYEILGNLAAGISSSKPECYWAKFKNLTASYLYYARQAISPK